MITKGLNMSHLNLDGNLKIFRRGLKVKTSVRSNEKAMRKPYTILLDYFHSFFKLGAFNA